MSAICDNGERMYARGVADAIAFLGDDPASEKLRDELAQARERQAETRAMIDAFEARGSTMLDIPTHWKSDRNDVVTAFSIDPIVARVDAFRAQVVLIDLERWPFREG